MVSSSRWMVVVDVAPDKVRRKLDSTLRDLGFEEILPCVYTDRWTPPDRGALQRKLRPTLRGGVGRILICRLGRSAPVWLETNRL